MSKPTDERGTGSSVLTEDVHETDIGDREPSEAVVDVVAAILDEEPSSLEPLYRTVDPDALDGLYVDESDVSPTVRFRYEGLVVRALTAVPLAALVLRFSAERVGFA